MLLSNNNLTVGGAVTTTGNVNCSAAVNAKNLAIIGDSAFTGQVTVNTPHGLKTDTIAATTANGSVLFSDNVHFAAEKTITVIGKGNAIAL